MKPSNSRRPAKVCVLSSDILDMETVRVRKVTSRADRQPTLKSPKRVWHTPQFWLCVRIALFVLAFLAVLLLFPSEAH